MAAMTYTVSVAVVLCALLVQCLAQCDQQADNTRQECLSSRSLEANRVYIAARNSENTDYTAFCDIIKDVAKCMLPIVDRCGSLADKLKDYNGFIRFNSPPTNCSITDSNGVLFQKCMPSILAQCHVHVANIAELEKSDELNGGKVYVSTCPGIRRYSVCFETVKEGCNSQIIANFKNTLKKYRNHETYDCFPGDHEPIGTCRSESHSITCMQRYAPEIMSAARVDNYTQSSYTKTCQLVQKFYDCTAIKSSGCSKNVTDDDLLKAKRLADNYGCNLDKCSRLWQACQEKYSQQMTAAGDKKCLVMTAMAVCTRYAVRNICPPRVTTTVVNYFRDYLAPCRIAPVIDACDTAALGQCNLKYSQELRNVKPNDYHGCNIVRAFMNCMKPLMVNSCPALIHNVYKGVYKLYSSAPYYCDIDCPMDELVACLDEYIGEKGKVDLAVKSESVRGEYHSTCRYIAAYRSCIAKTGTKCKPTSMPLFTKHSDKYKLDSAYQCYEGKWCDMNQVQKCSFSFERDIAVVARIKTRAEHLAFCGHVHVYLRCLRVAMPFCPDSVRERETDVRRMYDGPCSLSLLSQTTVTQTTVTPCVGTCGVGAIASLPVLVTIAAGLALLWRK